MPPLWRVPSRRIASMGRHPRRRCSGWTIRAQTDQSQTNPRSISESQTNPRLSKLQKNPNQSQNLKISHIKPISNSQTTQALKISKESQTNLKISNHSSSQNFRPISNHLKPLRLSKLKTNQSQNVKPLRLSTFQINQSQNLKPLKISKHSKSQTTQNRKPLKLSKCQTNLKPTPTQQPPKVSNQSQNLKSIYP